MPKPQSANSLVGTSGDDALDASAETADFRVEGRAGNDTIYGGAGHDTLLGGRGDDLIYASVGDTLVDGGSGIDTVSFINSATGVRVELWDGGLGLRPELAPEDPGYPSYHSGVLRNIENVIGSNFDDRLVGSRVVNHLDGGGGNDEVAAYGSGDFLTGGAGADTLDVRQVIDGIRHGTGAVTITDFQYNDGDRIAAGPVAPGQLDWLFGSANDADGNLQPAWIGTWDLPTGGTFELIVLGTDAPTTDWFV